MTSFVYTAKRNLKSGHTVDTEYVFDIGMQEINRTTEADRFTRKSKSGVAGHYLNRIDVKYQLQTVPIQLGTDNIGNMREFLDSCLGGEDFTVDIYGTQADPDEILDAQLESANYSETRIGTTEFVTFSFTVRVF